MVRDYATNRFISVPASMLRLMRLKTVSKSKILEFVFLFFDFNLKHDEKNTSFMIRKQDEKSSVKTGPFDSTNSKSSIQENGLKL